MITHGKYYICVEDYIDVDTHSTRNRFIDCLEASNRTRGYYVNETGWYTMYSVNAVIPSFKPGVIYKAPFDGILEDDNHTRIEIKEEGKFREISFTIGDKASKFISACRKKYIYIDVLPYTLVDIDINEFKETGAIRKGNLWFKITVRCKYCCYDSVGIFFDDESVNNMLQALWKKIRIASSQCQLIKSALSRARMINHIGCNQLDNTYL